MLYDTVVCYSSVCVIVNWSQRLSKFKNIADILYRILTGTFWTHREGESFWNKGHIVLRGQMFIHYLLPFIYVSSLLQFAQRRNTATKKLADTNCNILHRAWNGNTFVYWRELDIVTSPLIYIFVCVCVCVWFRAEYWPIVNSTTINATYRSDVFRDASCRAREYSRYTFH